MDLQTRKLNLIEYLIHLQDEKLFSRIEAAIARNTRHDTRNLQPFTEQQLLDRAKLSDEDYKAGRFTTQEKLETESEKW